MARVVVAGKLADEFVGRRVGQELQELDDRGVEVILVSGDHTELTDYLTRTRIVRAGRELNKADVVVVDSKDTGLIAHLAVGKALERNTPLIYFWQGPSQQALPFVDDMRVVSVSQLVEVIGEIVAL